MGWLGMVASIKLPKKNGLQRLFHKKLGSSSSSGSQTCIFGFVSSFLWVWVFLLKLCRTDLEISGRSQLIVKHYILNFDCKKGCLNVKHPTCFFQSAFCFQKHKPKRRRFFRFPPKKSSTPTPPPPNKAWQKWFMNHHHLLQALFPELPPKNKLLPRLPSFFGLTDSVGLKMV